MKIVVRTDASVQIGTGHVMRCLTLADALRERGANCRFVCRSHEGNLLEHIRQQGFEAIVLPAETQSEEQTEPKEKVLDHAEWLGVHWQVDAQRTLESLNEECIDWLIVDHYALDERWESALRPQCKNIMVIDDLADRHHDCDLLLDQNLDITPDRYSKLLPTNCLRLLGPRYALLNPAYAAKRTEVARRTGAINRVLLYFGGGEDSVRLTGIALRTFCEPELLDVQLDIVLGSGAADAPEIRSIAMQRGHVTIHSNLPDLAELMFEADIAVGAGGSSTWERCSLGLPTILVICALNQVAIGKAMKSSGAALVINSDSNPGPEIKDALLLLRKDADAYLKMSKNAFLVCDGFGTEHVVKSLLG